MADHHPLHLYVHFPFCAACLPVDGRVIYTKGHEDQLAYTAALENEMRLAAPDFANSRVESLLIGGGSPLMLGPERLSALLKTLHHLFDFSPAAEITLEVQPSQLTAGWMVHFQHMGVNRLWIDVISGRSSDYERLALPGNLSTAQTCLMLPQIFRLPHYAPWIFYGLPGQTEAQCLVSTRFLCKYHAPEVILARFTAPGSAAWRALPVSREPVPDEAAARALTRSAREHLIQKGYEEYLPDHFALPGFASRYERALAGNEDLLAFGVGVRSRTDGVMYQTTSILPHYLADSGRPEKLYTVLGRAPQQ